MGANSEALLTGARLRLSGSPGVTRVGEKRGPKGACSQATATQVMCLAVSLQNVEWDV